MVVAAFSAHANPIVADIGLSSCTRSFRDVHIVVGVVHEGGQPVAFISGFRVTILMYKL